MGRMPLGRLGTVAATIAICGTLIACGDDSASDTAVDARAPAPQCEPQGNCELIDAALSSAPSLSEVNTASLLDAEVDMLPSSATLPGESPSVATSDVRDVSDVSEPTNVDAGAAQVPDLSVDAAVPETSGSVDAGVPNILDASRDVSADGSPDISTAASTDVSTAAQPGLADGGEETAMASSGSQIGTVDVPPEPVANNDQNMAPPLEGAATKVDLLLVVDNSSSMADKQVLLRDALPDLVQRLISPACVDDEGNVAAPDLAGVCAVGQVREFSPVTDLHLAVITTSLGGYGSQSDCGGLELSPGDPNGDMAHLLGALPRGQLAAPGAADSGFLSWNAGNDPEALVNNFGNLVAAAGETGCGWEATLESWLRFLVEPHPYTRVVRRPCNANDTMMSCSGPEADAGGVQLIDTVLLAQRAAFLRTDSVLSVLMLSDENDCSFKPSGQSWRLAQSFATVEGTSNEAYYPAFRGTAACEDPSFGPNHQCCHSCGQASFPDGCPSAADSQGNTVALGCEAGRKFSLDDQGDHPNLRCFNQKQRFGVDYLFPTRRYVNALTQEHLCLTSDTLATNECEPELWVRNPIFALQDGQRRPDAWVYLVGILGVPWQDLALDPSAEKLRYRSNDPTALDSERINWDWLLGDPEPADGVAHPSDPFMQEQLQPRSGTNPATGQAIVGPNGDFAESAINGHDWNIADESDLQYACTFELKEPVTCLTSDESEQLADEGNPVPYCDCTDYPTADFANPLCQTPEGEYGLTQYFGKAYPALRELEVLRGLGANAIVASICPKEMDNTKSDYGYRPAVDAMLARIRPALGVMNP